MDELNMQYAIAKQLPTATAVMTNYGDIELDEEMRQAVEDALTQIIDRRLQQHSPDQATESTGYFDRLTQSLKKELEKLSTERTDCPACGGFGNDPDCYYCDGTGIIERLIPGSA